MAECEVTISENFVDDEKNKKKMNRKTSELWNYFTALNNEYALCNYCNQKFSYRTSTSNLKKHMLCKHSSHRTEKSPKFYDENISPSQPGSSNVSPTEKLIVKKESNHRLRSEDLNVSRSPLFTDVNNKRSWASGTLADGDEYDAFGVTVAAKLRKMEEKQRLFCERIINDALFKGALQQLNPLSEIVICLANSHTS